jgi:hypothetical protein
MPDAVATRRRAVELALLAACVASVLTTGWLLSGTLHTIRQTPSSAWMVARASGITSYLLMTALVLLGLHLSHPGSTRIRRLSRMARMQIHSGLAFFTLAFTALHVVVLATDPFAQVGWAGALLPMASTYRPVPVTLGVIAMWAAALTAITASLAGRLPGRLWWPIHKVAAGVFALSWAHGLLAGSDTAALTWCYLSTGLLVVLVAVSRYTARTPADELADHEARSVSPMPDSRTVRR